MINLTVLQGRLTADVELRVTSTGGKYVCGFTIAVDNGYGDNKQTSFINCVAWNKTAEFISKYFHKGSMIAIEGSIQTRKFTDKEGNNRTAFEVVANNVHFIESKKDSKPSVDVNPDADPLISFSNKNGEFVEVDGDSDLPF